MSDLYDERPKPIRQEVMQPTVMEESPYTKLNDIIANQIEIEEGVLYLNDEIEGHTLFDLMMRIRHILNYRTGKEFKGNQTDPLNLMINSPGGDIHEMMGIVDYIESLDVKTNTICRGRAFSAASIILTCGTGVRMASKNSTIMFHQASSMISGKLTDVTATVEFVKKVEQDIYELLAKKTKKDAIWWKDNMRSDMFLSAEQALDIGVIDQII